MIKSKKTLSLILSSILLNTFVINVNVMGGKKFSSKKRNKIITDSDTDSDIDEQNKNKKTKPDEESTDDESKKVQFIYGTESTSIKEQIDNYNKYCKEGYELEYWGGLEPNQLFERFQYLLNPVAFAHSSQCSFNLFNTYLNHKNWRGGTFWSIDKVRRQMNSGQDSDIEEEDYCDDGKKHVDRYATFNDVSDANGELCAVPDAKSDVIELWERNILALTYKYIQTEKHKVKEDHKTEALKIDIKKANEIYNGKELKVYFSSIARAEFIEYYDQAEPEKFLEAMLYTPFGNVKVKRTSDPIEKAGKIFRNVDIYNDNKCNGEYKYYFYKEVGEKFNKLDIGKQIEILELLNEYLNTKKYYNFLAKKWSEQVYNLKLTDEEKDAFAVLFGIAVLAEPLREVDGGASQRCVYRTMLHYLKELKENKRKLETDDDWEQLAKELENGSNSKHTKLLKFYKTIRSEGIKKINQLRKLYVYSKSKSQHNTGVEKIEKGNRKFTVKAFKTYTIRKK